MAITTDSYVTINGHSVGLSKVIAQVTLSEVEDVIYSGYLDDKRNCNMLPANQNVPLPRLASTSDSDSTVKVYHVGEFNLVTESSPLEGQLYFRNVLLYVENGYGFGGSAILYPDTYNAWHIHFITEIDIQELEMVCNADVNVQHTAGMKYYSSDVTYGSICPAQVIKDSDDKFIIATLGGYNCDNYTRFNSPILYNPSYDMYYFRRYNYPNAGYLNIDKSSRWCFEPNLRYSLGPCTFNGTSYQAPESLAKVTLTNWGGTNFFDITMNDPDSTNYIYYAWGGLRFTDGTKHYKPIVENGYITGYTDDDSVKSEFDEWENISDHTTPSVGPTPPGPSGDDEDNDDAIATAGAPYAKGLVNYYAMTAGSVLIDHISEALSTWDLQNTGKDLYKNLVSCKLIKPPAAIPTTGSEPLTIYGEKPQYQGADISLPVVSGNPDATFGPYSISRKFNDFRDYAPYTRVCIFLPYCGWCDLPSHVVGRSVTVKYFTDIIAATVRAVVFCNNNIIAEAAGVMGLDIPFTADAVGMKQAGVVSGLTAYAGGALQTAAGVASIVTTKGGKGIGEALSGASKLVSAYTQTAIAFNENTTEISGKNGDGCCLSGATNIIIKIIRPKYGASSTAPFVPAGFAHSVGFVSNKQVRVGNVSGLLIADNVDTSGIAGATDAERAEIKRVLETGLIVNAAPE